MECECAPGERACWERAARAQRAPSGESPARTEGKARLACRRRPAMFGWRGDLWSAGQGELFGQSVGFASQSGAKSLLRLAAGVSLTALLLPRFVQHGWQP